MNITTKNRDQNWASLSHLMVFSKYLFPLGNFIFPLLILSWQKDNKFVALHGKQALNFQISLFLYTILILCISVAAILFLGFGIKEGSDFIFSETSFRNENFTTALPILISIGVSGILLLALLILEIICVITATFKASEGKDYKYPLTIAFIKSSSNQSKNEQSTSSKNVTNED